MYCPGCGKKANDDSLFCSSCGTKLNVQKEQPKQEEVKPVIQVTQVNETPPVVQQPIQSNYVPPVQPKKGLAGWQKGVIVGLLSLVLVLMIALVVSTFVGRSRESSLFSKNKNYNSRTVMIYLVGSNLESQVFSATADMAQLDPNQIDFNNTNILIYTGGTSIWRNYVRNDENAIYKFTPNGFEKIESYPKAFMNDGKELTKFLKYGYDHYPADQFNLVLYDHGNAFQGAIVDDFDTSGKPTSLDTFDKAFKNSPFNGKDRKLNSVSFRTCLMGNLESALVFSKYADYMIASEEEIYLGKYIGVFGESFNGLKASDDEITTGKKFIQAYRNKLTDPKFNIDYPLTYSIIDLNKFDNLVNEFNKFIGGIDIDKYYYDIVRVRTNIYQFPMDPQAHNALDLVDVKELVNRLSKYSSVKPDAFYKAFDEAVVFNDTTLNDAHGLTVYFPFNSSARLREYNNSIFNKVEKIDTYKKFVKEIEERKSSTGGNNYIAGASNISVGGSNKNEVTYQLSDELYNNYSKSMYFLFRRDDEHKEYYQFVVNSYDTELTEDKKLKINITDKLIHITYDDGKGGYLLNMTQKNGDQLTSYSGGIFKYKEQEDEYGWNSANADFSWVEKDGKPTISSVRLTSRDDRINGGVYDINQFSMVTILDAKYKILDKKGKVMDTEDWESSATLTGHEFEVDEFDKVLEYKGMDDGEWYVLFFISDLDGNKYTSELVKVGE